MKYEHYKYEIIFIAFVILGIGTEMSLEFV